MKKPLLLLVAATTLGLAGCAAVPTVAAAPAVARDAAPTAHVEFSVDPRDVAGRATHDLTGESTCSSEAGTTKVSIRDDAAAKDALDALYLTIPATGATVVEPSFNSDRGGWSYDTSYVTSDGQAGTATATATVRDGRVDVVFDGRTWDGAVYSGTANCPLV